MLRLIWLTHKMFHIANSDIVYCLFRDVLIRGLCRKGKSFRCLRDWWFLICRSLGEMYNRMKYLSCQEIIKTGFSFAELLIRRTICGI